MTELAIERVEALACSVPMKQAVSQGLGQAVKRDTVVVKVTTTGGLTGYGESYNGRAPLAVAQTVNTTLRDLITGMNARETTHIWRSFEDRVLANHGTCAACVCAMSGIDMALWDIRGKAAGLPLYALLGGSPRPVPAYAGGFALGYADPAALAEEALDCAARGYAAVKLRLGDTLSRDTERTIALRSALPHVALLADANCRYSVEDVRAIMPALTEAGAGWLEEPFPPYRDRDWREAAAIARLPLAASVHFLASVDTSYYFEGDGSADNPLRSGLCSGSYDLSPDGTVTPLPGPGLGVDVDEDFLRAHPVTSGPAWR